MSAALDSPIATWSHVDVLRNPEDAEAAWRDLERVGVGTPYQRFDWLASWYAAMCPAKGAPAIVLASDASGSPLALLPLVLVKSGPATVARFAGGKHCNANMALFDPEFMRNLTPYDAGALMFAIRERLPGVDLFDLRSQPVSWAGEQNPLARLAGARRAEDAHSVAFAPGETEDALVRRLVSKDSRKKLAKKLRWLEDGGPVSLRRAATPAEASRVLDAFFRQRAERFRSQHIANPFGCRSVQDFVRRAALAGLDEGRPALELWALWSGERITAVLGGCFDGRRLSATFISFEQDKALMRASPGELLTMEIAKATLRRGAGSFDLGMGDEGYKRHVCPDREARVDVVMPLTPVGHALAIGMRGADRVKEMVKRDHRILRTVRLVASRFGV